MKKSIIIVTIILAVFLQMSAQKTQGPKIAFEETVFDFDTIMQNGNGEHVFRFTNTGDAPLLITSAFSSCGCVVPEWPREPIAPKAKASIKVKYNTSKVGAFTKVIIVKSNDTASPKTVLRINGVVVEEKKQNAKTNQISRLTLLKNLQL
ncbi:MAG: DUF1573 domain-containing protein [Bacteroidales bacterium]|nr:DUF1573 domain-containing protein [Bacteroidales bacterium]